MANSMSASVVFCPHCDNYVAERTFRRHKSEYFDTLTNSWSPSGYDKSLSSPEKKRCLNNSRSSGNDHIELITCSPNKNSEYCSNTFPAVNHESDIEGIELQSVSNNFVNGHLNEIWENVSPQDVDADLSRSQTVPNSDKKVDEENAFILILARWIVHFVSSWSVFFNISATALQYLLTFLHALFSTCGVFSPYLLSLSNAIPKSIYTLRKTQGILEDDFIKYVVCSKCDMLYTLAEAEAADTCTHVEYPNHTQQRFRAKCGQVLFKEVTLQDGSKKKYLIKIFCYRPIKRTLQTFLDRKGFQQQCEEWRHRKVVQGTYRDVYDGRIWRTFEKEGEEKFFDVPRRFGLLLNVDWFQPYKHSPYSVGGIYLSILNLPRNQRFKKENVITAGIIPGPDEPSKNINTYLRPLVDELTELWETGFIYKARDDIKDEEYFAALVCCSCDVPATRKLGGFLGHNAKAGCSKCNKNFKTGKFGEKTDFSGFETNEPRKDKEHRRIAEEVLQQTHSSGRQKLESKYGVRYTELMQLAYFDSIASFVVDPMHNLFQGTAKYVFKTMWADKLNSQALVDIQAKMDKISVPATLGRIPRKIQSSFSSFTSDQWKNWTLYFSPIVLKDYLPRKDYGCWLLFVEACRYLCMPSMTIQELRKGHETLLDFCRTFERLYGTTAITPNMHLHTHLIECIIDFGPFHGFWLFGFERMNGVLGSFNTNQRSPEIQFMRKMIETQHVFGIEKEASLAEMFKKSFDFETSDSFTPKTVDLVNRITKLSTGNVIKSSLWILEADITFSGKRQDFCISEHYLTFLRQATRTIVDVDESDISGCCSRHYSVEMCGEKYGSSNSRLCRSSVILASWCGNEGDIQTEGTDVRPGVIRFFVSFFIRHNGKFQSISFAYVHWFKKVPHTYNSLVSLWCREMFEPEGPACFLPLQRIARKAICGQVKVKNEHVLAVIPHLRQLYY